MSLLIRNFANEKNQHRSGTCWDFATLGYLESEILRKTGKTYDLCEMFVVNKDYMDCATYLFLNRHALPKDLPLLLQQVKEYIKEIE